MTDRLFTDCCYGTDQQHGANQVCPQDIVTRLRDISCDECSPCLALWAEEAADLIESQQATIQSLRDALADLHHAIDNDGLPTASQMMRAEAALRKARGEAGA